MCVHTFRAHTFCASLACTVELPPGPCYEFALAAVAPGGDALDPFQIGTVIAAKYEITRVLGQGGMGVVVAARHRDLGELVALKFLRPSSSERPESLARFAREARTATRIKNEHVARVYDTGTVDGRPFLVMEYLTDRKSVV